MSPIGKPLTDPSIPTPSVVLDLAKLETNCSRMLETVSRLDLAWRPHVKTHKTLELTRLQVGSSRTVNIIVSTVIEAEYLLPLLQEYQAEGRSVNVLYSFPVYNTVITRLASLCKTLGPKSISLMVDHPAQIPLLTSFTQLSGYPPLVYLKINGGYHRAGVPLPSDNATTLITSLLSAEATNNAIFHGLYIHAGHSYDARDDWAALEYLADEFAALATGADEVRAQAPGKSLVLSVGATPTATSLQHPEVSTVGGESQGRVAAVNDKMASLIEKGFTLEVHAGVYPTLDLQQLATHARSSSLLSSNDIAISVLVDVVSAYPGRNPNGTTEYLINAGCLALGREPCKDMGSTPGMHYSSWGIPMSWPETFKNEVPGENFPEIHGGWQVGKISQEHGVLMCRGEEKEGGPQVGGRLRIWPNHACIAGAGFSQYLIVDSRVEKGDVVVGVWNRCAGW